MSELFDCKQSDLKTSLSGTAEWRNPDARNLEHAKIWFQKRPVIKQFRASKIRTLELYKKPDASLDCFAILEAWQNRFLPKTV